VYVNDNDSYDSRSLAVEQTGKVTKFSVIILHKDTPQITKTWYYAAGGQVSYCTKVGSDDFRELNPYDGSCFGDVFLSCWAAIYGTEY